MHSVMFASFDRICRTRRVAGRVLEIGARPSADTLLCLPAIASASERVGLDLDGPHEWRGMTILAGDANRMTQFADGSFDAVLTNSVLEHDARFWLTLAEIQRVLKPDGQVVIGVPGYGGSDSRPLRRLIGLSRFLPGFSADAGSLRASCLTLSVHNAPGDFYRFSEQAIRRIFLAGYDDIGVECVLNPPRFICWGRKPPR